MKTVILVLLVTAFSLVGWAEDQVRAQSAGRLAKKCTAIAQDMAGDYVATTNIPDIEAVGVCTGILQGYRTVIDELPVLTPDKTAQISIEKTATLGELEEVFVKYVREHPELAYKDGFVVFTYALRDAGLMLMTEVKPLRALRSRKNGPPSNRVAEQP